MRQHLSDEKVHYKLYKDGKNWVAASIATGIAIPVALFSAVFLSPVHEVQATSDDLGYTYTAGQSDLSNSEVADGIKAGTVYDATSNGSSTVKIDNTEIEKIAAAHLQLTLNGNTWSLSPDADFVKTSIDTVLTGLGYPTDAVSDPTSKTNAQSILDYLKKDGLQSVNGGSTAREDGNISWMVTPLISGSSLDMSGNQGGSINQADTLIGDTGFGAIIAGSLKVEDSDQAPFPTTNAQILLANHGYLNGTGSIPNGLINQLKQFSFADGSFASSMKRLQSATTQLMGLYSKTDGSAAVSFDQYNASTELDLDFSKAVKDANGDYVFTINSDTLKGNRYTFDWKNQAAYTGGNVIINYTGSSVINFQDTTNFKPDFLTGDNQIVLSVPNGNTINFTNADGPDQNHAVVLAPTSDVITNVGAYGGIVGAINGDGSNDGYDENTDPGNPINTNPKTPDTNVPDDPGNNPTKSTDTTKTPDDGGDTTTTTTSKTPESKAVTVNQTISTSVSDKDGIDPTDIPESDLPKNTETKSTTFTATVKDDGTVSYTNADGRISLEAPFNDVPVETTTKIGNTTYTVQVSGTLTDNSGLDEDTLDTKAVTDQIGQATDGTTLNWNISVVYFPSSTSKHKQVNFNNEVFFDYADDDFDSDPDNLPEDFTRTAVVSYVETTDSQGHSSYSDWQVEQSLDALTDANVPTMAGYRTNIENDITDDAIIGMLKSMGPINGASVTAETQVTYEKVVQLDDGIHVYTKAQQPGGVEQPSGTVGTNKPQGDPGDPLDTTDDDNNYVPDPDHVYTKAQQPGGVEQPSGTIGTNEPQGDPSDPLDTTDDNTNYVPDPDHVYTKAQQPGGVEQPSGTVGTNEPQGDPSDPLDTTDDDTNYVPDPDHVYTKAQQPGGVEQPSGTVGTNEPQGDPGDPLDTTDDDNNYVPDPDHVYTKAQQPGGVEQPSGTVGTNDPQGDPGDPLDTTDDNTNYVPDPDHVYTKAQQPGGVEQPSGTVGTNEPQGDPSDPLDTTDDNTNYVPDPDHVYTKAQQPGGVEQPSGTVGTNDPGDPLDTTDDNTNYVPDPDHVYTKAQQPGGVEQPSGTVGTNEPQGDPGDPLDTTDDDTNYVPDPDHVYTKAQQPGGVEQPSGTVGTNEPQGDPGDPLDTTDDNTNYVPDPDHVYTKAQQPDGVENMTTTPSGDDGRTTTTTPSGNDGQTTTTTTPSGNDGQTTTTTTPSGNDGQTTTTTTPSGDNGQTTTTIIPSGDDGQTTTTTTPSGDDGQTTTTTTPSGDNDQTPETTVTTPATGNNGGLTTNTNTATPIQTTTPNTAAGTTQLRTGNGLTGQTPATSTTTVNPDGTTSRTLTYVDATQAPVATTAQASQTQTPAANAKTQTVDANKAGIPDQTATIADQANTPAVASPAESVTTVANVIDDNAELTHGNIFIAGGAPGMADYTFFSQPVMDSSTNSVDHYELLLRVWDSKQGGWHLPASFSIPASMEAHLMARAVAQLDVKDISINLTDAQFEDPDTQKAITDLAQSDAVDSLTVELATIPDSEELAANAKVFQAAGVKVTLDNLGSHTDGTQLANAADHVDTLKVSLRGMRRDGNNLTQMTNQLAAWQKAAAAHNDSLEVEGLETPEDLAMTNDLGITAVQGYYFSRPAMPGTRADLM